MLAAAVLASGCGAGSTTDTSAAPTIPTSAGDDPAANDRTTTTTTTSTTTSTTTTISATGATPTTSTVNTLTDPVQVETLLTLRPPVADVAVFGDSLFASHTGSSLMFDLVHLDLYGLDVGVEHVENLAVAGQGYVDGMHLAEPGWHELDTYLVARHGEPFLQQLDLAIVSLSRIDLNRMPRDAGIEAVDELADAIARRLQNAVSTLHDLGAQVAIVPAFGTNDGLFDALQCARGDDHCWPRELDAKAARLNARLVEAGLPMLFERFAGVDLDGRGGVDVEFVTGFDPSGRWPDDGQHPNALGEQVIAANIAHHLAVAFGAPGADG